MLKSGPAFPPVLSGVVLFNEWQDYVPRNIVGREKFKRKYG